MLNVIVVSDQVKLEVISNFCIFGIVNKGVLIEFLNGLPAGLSGQFLQ